MSDLLTTAHVAARLGVSPRRVRALAVRRRLGILVTPQLRLFTEADVAAMQVRTRGRPKHPPSTEVIMSRYLIARHQPDGAAYALRTDDAGAITGVCGPLDDTEQDAPGADYHYDDQREDVPWANAADWAPVKDLDA